VLAVLAFGAVATSFLGIPMLWTGKAPILERFLDATFGNSAELVKTVYHHGEGHNMELLLMLASLAIATLGLGIAWWLYRGRTNTLPSRVMARMPLLYKVVYNKYYVDEIYQASAVRAFMGTSNISNWFDQYIVDGIVNLTGRITELFSRVDGLIDAYVVDGMVNLVGNTVRALGQALRRLQTGKLPSYLAGTALGAIILVLLARFILDMF
jgi:NADH-quinone oxidoreductase subunit L